MNTPSTGRGNPWTTRTLTMAVAERIVREHAGWRVAERDRALGASSAGSLLGTNESSLMRSDVLHNRLRSELVDVVGVRRRDRDHAALGSDRRRICRADHPRRRRRLRRGQARPPRHEWDGVWWTINTVTPARARAGTEFSVRTAILLRSGRNADTRVHEHRLMV
jgi:hypothetical protein